MNKPLRRSRIEQTEVNRAAVLNAAERVFRERGYTAASLEHIADAAGFSKGVVYSRFGSKADLFLALLGARIERRAEAHAATLRAWRRAPRAGSADVLVRLAESSAENTDWQLALLEFRLVAARDPALNARYAALHASTVERLAHFLDELADTRGIPHGMRPSVLATAFLALETGMTLEALVASAPLSSAQRAEFARRLLSAHGETLPSPDTSDT